MSYLREQVKREDSGPEDSVSKEELQIPKDDHEAASKDEEFEDATTHLKEDEEQSPDSDDVGLKDKSLDKVEPEKDLDQMNDELEKSGCLKDVEDKIPSADDDAFLSYLKEQAQREDLASKEELQHPKDQEEVQDATKDERVDSDKTLHLKEDKEKSPDSDDFGIVDKQLDEVETDKYRDQDNDNLEKSGCLKDVEDKLPLLEDDEFMSYLRDQVNKDDFEPGDKDELQSSKDDQERASDLDSETMRTQVKRDKSPDSDGSLDKVGEDQYQENELEKSSCLKDVEDKKPTLEDDQFLHYLKEQVKKDDVEPEDLLSKEETQHSEDEHEDISQTSFKDGKVDDSDLKEQVKEELHGTDDFGVKGERVKVDKADEKPEPHKEPREDYDPVSKKDLSFGLDLDDSSLNLKTHQDSKFDDQITLESSGNKVEISFTVNKNDVFVKDGEVGDQQLSEDIRGKLGMDSNLPSVDISTSFDKSLESGFRITAESSKDAKKDDDELGSRAETKVSEFEPKDMEVSHSQDVPAEDEIDRTNISEVPYTASDAENSDNDWKEASDEIAVKDGYVDDDDAATIYEGEDIFEDAKSSEDGIVRLDLDKDLSIKVMPEEDAGVTLPDEQEMREGTVSDKTKDEVDEQKAKPLDIPRDDEDKTVTDDYKDTLESDLQETDLLNIGTDKEAISEESDSFLPEHGKAKEDKDLNFKSEDKAKEEDIATSPTIDSTASVTPDSQNVETSLTEENVDIKSHGDDIQKESEEGSDFRKDAKPSFEDTLEEEVDSKDKMDKDVQDQKDVDVDDTTVSKESDEISAPSDEVEDQVGLKEPSKEIDKDDSDVKKEFEKETDFSRDEEHLFEPESSSEKVDSKDDMGRDEKVQDEKDIDKGDRNIKSPDEVDTEKEHGEESDLTKDEKHPFEFESSSEKIDSKDEIDKDVQEEKEIDKPPSPESEEIYAPDNEVEDFEKHDLNEPSLEVDDTQGSKKEETTSDKGKLSTAKAIGMGFIAVVGAPVIAGMAIAEALKTTPDRHPEIFNREHPQEQWLNHPRECEATSDAEAQKSTSSDDKVIESSDNKNGKTDKQQLDLGSGLETQMKVKDDLPADEPVDKGHRSYQETLVQDAEDAFKADDDLSAKEKADEDEEKTKESIVASRADEDHGDDGASREDTSKTSGYGSDEPWNQSSSLTKILQSRWYDSNMNMFVDQEGGKMMNLAECIDKGLIDTEEKIIADLDSGEVIGLKQAIQRQLIDPSSSLYYADDKTQLPLGKALENGLIMDDSIPEISPDDLMAASKPPSNGKLPVDESIGGLVDVITQARQSYGLVDAVKSGILDPHTNFVKDPSSGRQYTLVEAMDRGLIITRTAVFRDPGTGKRNTFDQLLRRGCVSLKSGDLALEGGGFMAITDAVHMGFLTDERDLESGETLERPLSLMKILDKGLYDPLTGHFIDPETEERLTLTEALDENLLDPLSAVLNDPASEKVCSLEEALMRGLVSERTGAVYDTQARKKISLIEATRRGIVIPLPMNLNTAVDIGLFNEETGKFYDPTCGMCFVLQEAIDNGLIDSRSLIVDPATGKVMAVATATACGILDARNGNVINIHTGQVLSLKDAVILPTRHAQMEKTDDGHRLSIIQEEDTISSSSSSSGSKHSDGKVPIDKHVLEKTDEEDDISPSEIWTKDDPDINKFVSDYVLKLVDDALENLRKDVSDSNSQKLPKVGRDEDQYQRNLESNAADDDLTLPAGDEEELKKKELEATQMNTLEESILKELSDHHNWLESLEKQLMAQTTDYNFLDNNEKISKYFISTKKMLDEYESKLTSVEHSLMKSSLLLDSNPPADLQHKLNDLSDRVLVLMDSVGDETRSRHELLQVIHSEKLQLDKSLENLDKVALRSEEALRSVQKSLGDPNRTREQIRICQLILEDAQECEEEIPKLSNSAQIIISSIQKYEDRLEEFRPSVLAKDTAPVQLVRAQHHDLADQLRSIIERLDNLSNCSNNLIDKLEGMKQLSVALKGAESRMVDWCDSAENMICILKDEDKRTEDSHRDAEKFLSVAFEEGLRQLNEVKDISRTYIDCLKELGADDAAIESVNLRLNELSDRLDRITNEAKSLTGKLLADHFATLDPDVGLEDMSRWLENIEQHLHAISSVDLDNIQALLQNLWEMQAQLESRQSVLNMIDVKGDLDLEAKKKNLITRIADATAQCSQRISEVERLKSTVAEFKNMLNKFDDWLVPALVTLNSLDLSRMSLRQFQEKVDNVSSETMEMMADLLLCKKLCRDLISPEDKLKDEQETSLLPLTTTGQHIIQDPLGRTEANWTELQGALSRKKEEIQERQDKEATLRAKMSEVSGWLSKIEGQVLRLQTIALDVDVVKEQMKELDPILEMFDKQTSNILEINNIHDLCYPPQRTAQVRSHQRGDGIDEGQFRPASSESSGVSSKPNSVDNLFHVETLTEDYQKLNIINAKHDRFSEILADRQMELQATLSDLTQLQDQLDNYDVWLDKTSDDLDSILQKDGSHENVESEKMIKEMKESLLQKEEELDHLKSRTQQILLKGKQNVQGHDDIVNRFNSLKEKFEKLKDPLNLPAAQKDSEGLPVPEEDASNLQDFEASQNRILNWLDSKSKMASLLSPVSSDSNVLHNQLQQVKLLKKELQSNQDVLKEFLDLGSKLAFDLESDQAGHKAANKVRSSMEKAKQSRDRLSPLLNDLESRLQNTIDLRANRDRLHDSINNKLTSLANQIEALPSVDNLNSNWIGEQADQAKKMLSNLASLQPDLEKLGRIDHMLCQSLGHDDSWSDSFAPSATADLQAQREDLKTRMDKSKSDLENRLEELDDLKRGASDLKFFLTRAREWIDRNSSTLKELSSISCQRDVLTQQISKCQALVDDLTSRQDLDIGFEKFTSLINEAGSTSDPQDKEKLEELEQNLEALRKEAATLSEKMSLASGASYAYLLELSRLKAKLKLFVDKVSWIMALPENDSEEIATKRDEFESLLREMERFQSKEFDALQEKGHNLIDLCTTGHSYVEDELAAILDDVEQLRLNAEKEKNRLDLNQEAHELLNDQLNDIQSSLHEVEKLIRPSVSKAQSSLTVPVDPQQKLEQLVSLQKELKLVEGRLKDAKMTLNDLCTDAIGQVPKEEAESVEEACLKYETLSSEVANEIARLRSLSSSLQSLQGEADQLQSDLMKIQEDIKNNLPSDMKAAFHEKLLKDILPSMKVKAQTIGQSGKEISGTLQTWDSDRLDSSLKDIMEELGALESSVESRMDASKRAVKHVEDYSRDVQRLLDEMSAVRKELKNLPEEGDLLEEFYKNKLFELGDAVEALRRRGSLISREGDVDGNVVNDLMNEVDMQWNDLLEKLSDKQKRVGEVLLENGQFQETMNCMESWLHKVKDMQKSQEPFAVSSVGLKKQLETQKLLDKLVASQKPSYEKLLQMSKDDPQIEHLKKCWEDVCRKSRENRNVLGQLEDLIPKYEGEKAAMDDWLSAAEKKLVKFSSKDCFTSVDGIPELLEKIIGTIDDATNQIAHKDRLAGVANRIVAVAGDSEDADHLLKEAAIMETRFAKLSQSLGTCLEKMKEIPKKMDGFYGHHKNIYGDLTRIESKLDEINAATLTEKGTTFTDHEQTVMSLISQLEDCENQHKELKKEGISLADLIDGQVAREIKEAITKEATMVDLISGKAKATLDRVKLRKQRSSELLNDVENLLEAANDLDRKLAAEDDPTSKSHPSSDAGSHQQKLKRQKALAEEADGLRKVAKDLITKVRALSRSSSFSEDSELALKTEELNKKTEEVTHRASDMVSHLEKNLELNRDFKDIRKALVVFFNNFQRQLDVLVSVDKGEGDALTDETYQQLRSLLVQQRPVFDRLTRTITELKRVVPAEQAEELEEVVSEDKNHFVKLSSDLDVLFKKLDDRLEAKYELEDKLRRLEKDVFHFQEQFGQLEPISVYPENIIEQKTECFSLAEEIKALKTSLGNLEREFQLSGLSMTPENMELFSHVESINHVLEEASADLSQRRAILSPLLELSRAFWNKHMVISCTLQELMLADEKEATRAEAQGSVDPLVIAGKISAHRDNELELESLSSELELLKDQSATIQERIGFSRPELEDAIKRLESRLSGVQNVMSEKSQLLDVSMDRATKFHEEMQKFLIWLQKIENVFIDLGPTPSDSLTIKWQIDIIKNLDEEIQPKHQVISHLNDLSSLLVSSASSPKDGIEAVTEPMTDANRRWIRILEVASDRKGELNRALLNMGEVQNSLDDLKSWLERSLALLERPLTNYEPVKVIEADIAVMKNLLREITSHQEHLDAVKEKMSERNFEEAAGSIEGQVNDLERQFVELDRRARDRLDRTEQALDEVKTFYQKLEGLQSALSKLETRIGGAQFIGLLPQTLSNQEEHLEDFAKEVASTGELLKSVLFTGALICQQCPSTFGRKLRSTLDDLSKRFDALEGKTNERRNRLQEAGVQVNNYHDLLNSAMSWLSGMERTFSNLQPISRDLDTLMEQMEQHKKLQQEINSHRHIIHELETAQSNLKFPGTRQDHALIKNLTASQSKRWEKLLSKSAERTRHLDNGHKEAKLFSDVWKNLYDWLTELDAKMDGDEVSSEIDQLKSEMDKHKELQRTLGSKQPTLDSVMRMGRSLKDRANSAADAHGASKLHDKMLKLKGLWLSVCGKAVDRQKQLEDGLLKAGRFKEALQVLLDWLYKVEPNLNENLPVHGDVDTVNMLAEHHKIFQKELLKKTSSVAAVHESAKKLLMTSSDDSSIQSKLIDMTAKWDRVCHLSVCRQERLKAALEKAEEFHNRARQLLDWLSEAERQLKYQPLNVDTEEQLDQLLADHQRFEGDLEEWKGRAEDCVALGTHLMHMAHHEAVPTLRHWLNTIRCRLDDVTSASELRGRRLKSGVEKSRSNAMAMEELTTWLGDMEQHLAGKEAQTLPENIPILEQLKQDHAIFESDLLSRQSEIEKFASSVRRQAWDVQRPLSNMSWRTASMKKRKTIPPPLPSEPTFKDPRAAALFNRWRHVWIRSMDRHKKLQELIDRLEEEDRLKNFDFDVWRLQYITWMRQNKTRTMDFFYRQDKDRDGKVTRKEFIEGILKSGFRTTPLEMEAVADKFDFNQDGFIDYREFVAALRWPDKRGRFDGHGMGQKIRDEVDRQAKKCSCSKQFSVDKVGNDRYRFGESQKLRLVRILRSTVMVRVGGGWVALDEFLVKNDPCRVSLWPPRSSNSQRRLFYSCLPKGRTNIDLREPFLVPIGASHAYANFKPKTPSRSLGDVSQPPNQRATPPPQSVGRSSRIPMKASRYSPHPDHARHDASQSQKRPKMKEPTRTPCSSATNSRMGSRASSRSDVSNDYDAADTTHHTPSSAQRGKVKRNSLTIQGRHQEESTPLKKPQHPKYKKEVLASPAIRAAFGSRRPSKPRSKIQSDGDGGGCNSNNNNNSLNLTPGADLDASDPFFQNGTDDGEMEEGRKLFSSSSLDWSQASSRISRTLPTTPSLSNETVSDIGVLGSTRDLVGNVDSSRDLKTRSARDLKAAASSKKNSVIKTGSSIDLAPEIRLPEFSKDSDGKEAPGEGDL